jgi:hypothetical protein
VAHAKYSDEKLAADDGEKVLDTPEYRLVLYGARRCEGDGRASSGEGPGLSSLVERSMGGDWSWKPERDKTLGDYFVTFRGVPPGAPEIAAHARHLRGENGAVRYA